MEPGTTADVEGITHHCDDNEGNIQYYTTGMSKKQFILNNIKRSFRNFIFDEFENEMKSLLYFQRLEMLSLEVLNKLHSF